MGRPISMKIDTRAVQRRFALVGPCVRRNVALATSLTSINVQRIAKQLVPTITSRLKNSIQIEPFEEGLVQTVGSNVEYAGFVEFGTSKQRAQPYLRPAMEAQLGPHRTRVKKATEACLK